MVCLNSCDNSWEIHSQISAEDNISGFAHFGESVSVYSSNIAVGAPGTQLSKHLAI